ncbi:MAG: ribonuclease III [Bacteroidales bacterium]
MHLFSGFSVFFSPDKKLCRAVKNIFGFYPSNIHLYQQALRHKSVSIRLDNGQKISNERLEYLGDAVLSAVVADYLFRKYPFKDEGFLTEMRARIVSRVQLNKLSRKLGLTSLIEADPQANHRSRSLSGNALEAFVGAIYLDKGYRFTRKILVRRILDIHFDMEQLQSNNTNFKSQIIEWSQRVKIPVEFRMVEEMGSGFGKQYKVHLMIRDEVYGEGIDYSIKGAEQIAAGKAMARLTEEQEV